MPTLRLEADSDHDREAIRRVVHSAFGGTEEVKLIDALRAAGSLVLSEVAEIGDTVVGHVAYSDLEVDGATKVAAL